jgi:hypothetical protein
VSSQTRKSANPDPVPLQLPDSLPRLPDEVKVRFPPMGAWEMEMDSWWTQVKNALRRANAEPGP